MPRSPVDQEDFLAWLEHPVTRWARDRQRLRAVEIAENQRDYLLNNSPTRTPQEWAQDQVQSARLLGLCEGIMEFAELSYGNVREETDDEIKELEKNANE
jgi:hypothetical protein